MPAARPTRWLALLVGCAAAFAGAPSAGAESILVKVRGGGPPPQAFGLLRSPGPPEHLLDGWFEVRLPKGLSVLAASDVLRRAGPPWLEGWAPDSQLTPAAAPAAPSGLPDDPLLPAQWALLNGGQDGGLAGADVGAPAAWQSVGPLAPVVVAVLDSGLDVSHPDLAPVLWTNPREVAGNRVDDDGNGLVDDVHGWDFANRDASLFDEATLDRHGTQVAGVVGAAAGNATGIAGVAPNARLLVAKFLDGGSGSTSDALRAMRYAIDAGAQVINASWGSPDAEGPLCDAVRSAWTRGVLVVAAAGNGGQDLALEPYVPAACPAALAVASIDRRDRIAPSSNRGRAVALAAPGVDVLSTAPGGGTATMSGTSAAAPHVAGAAALLWGAMPAAAVADVAGALRAGAAPRAGGEWPPRLDVAGALAALRGPGAAAVGAAPPPSGGRRTARQALVAASRVPILTQRQRRLWVRAASRARPAVLCIAVDGRTLRYGADRIVRRPARRGRPAAFGVDLPPLALGRHAIDLNAPCDPTEASPAAARTVTAYVLRRPPRSPRLRVRVAGRRVVLRWPAVGNIGLRARYRVLVDGSVIARTRRTGVTLRRAARPRRVQVVVVAPGGFRFAGPPRVVR